MASNNAHISLFASFEAMQARVRDLGQWRQARGKNSWNTGPQDSPEYGLTLGYTRRPFGAVCRLFRPRSGRALDSFLTQKSRADNATVLICFGF